jgi:putative colanic acid biosynthesis acetyltransferase WcaF
MGEPEAQGAEFLEKALAEGSLRAKVSPWTTKEKIGRALWMLLRVPLFRLSWHNWYAWRRAVLRAFGAKIGHRCNVRPTVRIEIPWLLEMDDCATLGDYAIVYNLGRVRIGKRTTVSQYAHLCAGSHDITKVERPLLRPEIRVGDDCWIAADAFVGPGVTVADGTILGARASLFGDTEPWSIYAGNPAKRLRERPRPEASGAGQT